MFILKDKINEKLKGKRLMVNKAQKALNSDEQEVKEFIDVVNKDFYITLSNYANYKNTHFDTDQLSLTEILSIIECYVLNFPKGGYGEVTNFLNGEKMMNISMYRINRCENRKIRQKALKIVKGLLCYDQFFDDRGYHLGAGCYSQKLVNCADFKEKNESLIDLPEPYRRSTFL